MSQNYRELEADMLALVTSLDGVLNDQEAQEVRQFIDVGEYGVAFETLCAIIKDERRMISESIAVQIARLGQQMGFDNLHWNWTRLHDATLESLELLWPSGKLLLRIRTGDSTNPQCLIAVSAVCRIDCERRMPWGPSASINEVRGPTFADDGTSTLEIEMQSGDLLRIEAGAFTMREAE